MRTLMMVAMLLTAALPARAEDAPRADLVRCRNGAVVSVSGPASEAGLNVLQRGGNAVDAAVAMALALAVTYPEAGNIGGGGYMLIVPAGRESSPVAIDFREVAPAAATREMFVDPEGRAPHRRVGVPGTLRGLELAHRKHGRLPWKELVTPAIALARDGFLLDAAVAKSINDVLRRSDKADFAELHRAFAKPGSPPSPWQAGDRLIQPDLAATLAILAERGADGFYTGRIAERVAAEIRRGRGLVTADDLRKYAAKERPPVRGRFRGCDVYGCPPSSSGGTMLVLMLQMLEPFDLRTKGRWSPETLHLMVEAMRRAYRERAAHLADPDFVEIPKKLASVEFARELARTIDPAKATPSIELAGEIPIQRESEQTTHFSVVDRDRTAVSVTYTLESGWGSRVVVPRTGFVLNDEMNDFNWLPGVTDAAGRIGTAPNQVAPGKRMLSSMSPTVVVKDGRPLLVTGSPGGRTIINTALCVVLNVVEFEMDVRAAVDAPRLHHAWFPDRVRIEPALDRDHAAAIARLRALGHTVDVGGNQGDAHTIWIDPRTGEITAAADTRISGRAAGY